MHRLLVALPIAMAMLFVLVFADTRPADAQQNFGGVNVPGFWDPKRRPERPELPRTMTIRFVTEEDYPPFNFKGPDGQLIGFNIDLARALCNELGINCTIQVRRFDTIVKALEENSADAAIASLAITPEIRKLVSLTDRYYRTPARFAAKQDFPTDDVTPEGIIGKRVTVVAGSAHEAYLRDFFAETAIVAVPTLDEAATALKNGEADLVFGDGIALAFWLNGSGSANCCAFRGGPFSESRYFGEGVGIAVRRENETIRQALNHALFRLWEKGIFADLYLRYFPIGFY